MPTTPNLLGRVVRRVDEALARLARRGVDQPAAVAVLADAADRLSWQHRNTPLVLTAMTLSHSASVMSSIRATVMTPAFCTEMSTRPNSFSGEIVERVDLPRSGHVDRIDATLAPCACAQAPRQPRGRAGRWRRRRRRRRPPQQSASRSPAPMPRLAPVTTTTFPSKRVHGARPFRVYQQTKPPSTIRSMPVQNDAARLARNTAGPTSSSTLAMRPIGVSRSNILTCSATSGRLFIGVSV